MSKKVNNLNLGTDIFEVEYETDNGQKIIKGEEQLRVQRIKHSKKETVKNAWKGFVEFLQDFYKANKIVSILILAFIITLITFYFLYLAILTFYVK